MEGKFALIMTGEPIRCLILACGNPLRRDDGVGPWLATWAHARFQDDPTIRVVYRQQWTPELTDELSRAGSAIFIDASLEAAPGSVLVRRISSAQEVGGIPSHHLSALQLLALCTELYETEPKTSLLMTIGIGSIEFGDTFSEPVRAAVEDACAQLEVMVAAPHHFVPQAPES